MNLKLTGDQMVMLASVQQSIPMIFTGSKKTEVIYTGGGTKANCFPHIKTFSQWEDDKHRDGLRIQLNQHLPHVRTSITNNIGHRLQGLSTAKVLAMKMLSRSIEFTLALNDFISDTYKEVLAASPRCDKEGSWDLVTFITQQLF
mmetsp:Transcript_785/g.1182  ORF Transcript_785/g.1182 Transcript_785/m.1182 type:complete len:145 (+) Transcript_785:1814-2248(+)